MIEQFGNYSILAVLGEGDMGTTYKAQHPQRQTPVALKILDKIDASSTLKREAAAEMMEFVATMQHPRLHPITRVLDNPTGQTMLALEMPLSEVGSIWDIIQQGKKISPKHGFSMIAQIATGLQFLHQQEVAHGSLKPSNILLDKEGNITLTDLPMAALRELGFIPAQITQQQQLFMSPQREYHAAPQIKDDVYSLAVIAFLLLTGEMPFSDPDPRARTEAIPGLTLPPTVAAVLRRAMTPLTQWRYTTLDEFMMALKKATKGEIDRDTEKAFGVTSTLPPLDDEAK